MTALTPLRRISLVGHGVAAVISLVLVFRAGSESALGLARSDDLPYGDLISLNRSGAVVWLVLALAGIAAAVLGHRLVARGVAAAWLVLAAIAFIDVVADQGLLGMDRPGTTAAAGALALVAAAMATVPDAQ